MKLKPLTQVDLEMRLLAGCGDPDCISHHRDSGTVAIYHHGGHLNIHCATCRRFVVSIAVALK